MTRHKDGMEFGVMRCCLRDRVGNILRDDLIQMQSLPQRRMQMEPPQHSDS